MEWRESIQSATERFQLAGLADAKTNAEYLAMHILGIWNRSELSIHLDEPLSAENTEWYEELLNRRLNHEPLQHIIGETEFFGLRLFTSPAALIPRPETEILVEEALSEAKKNPVGPTGSSPMHILDIGTGSGAIALAIASRLQDTSIIGIDISNEALALAKKNKERLKIENVSFEVLDIFCEAIEKRFPYSFDLLVSNPPYISAEEFDELEPEVKLFDPRIALTDDADGLIFYRRIAEVAPKILRDNGKIIVEISYGAANQVEKIFAEAGCTMIKKVKDLQGIERIIIASTGASTHEL